MFPQTSHHSPLLRSTPQQAHCGQILGSSIVTSLPPCPPGTSICSISSTRKLGPSKSALSSICRSTRESVFASAQPQTIAVCTYIESRVVVREELAARWSRSDEDHTAGLLSQKIREVLSAHRHDLHNQRHPELREQRRRGSCCAPPAPSSAHRHQPPPARPMRRCVPPVRC